MSTATDNPLALQVSQSQISDSESAVLLQTFEPFFREAQQWRNKAMAIQVTCAEDVLRISEARKARLALKEIRVNVEKRRKELKEESLRKGKAIDGMANVVKFLIVPIEEHLEKQEN